MSGENYYKADYPLPEVSGPRDGLIRISRGREFIGWARGWSIYLDDVYMGSVRWNSVKEIIAHAGRHSLYVKMDWCVSSSLRVFLKEGEVVDFKVSMPPGLLRQFTDVFLAPREYFTLRPVTSSPQRR